MTTDNPNPSNRARDNRQDEPEDELVEGNEVKDFFHRLPANFRRPKPDAEAVAAAVEAVQRLSGAAAAQEAVAPGESDEPGNACSACGGALPAGARFCVWCGVANQQGAAGENISVQRGTGQHHFHHHYHHFVAGQGTASTAPAAESAPSAPRGRAPGSPGMSSGGRAEATARQVVQDWAQACNTKHIDDLIELYAADATLIRPSVAPVRSLPAIREFLISLLEAGLGDVEMESLRVELLGEIALDIGRCKMLVPVAMGKRREERGKYIVVLVRQPAGTWKILADCWSSDSSVNAPPPESPARKGNEPVRQLPKLK